MDRRRFLRLAGSGAAAAVFSPGLPSIFGGTIAAREAVARKQPSILDLPASEAPIDHIVVLMMENRSFDHFMGWLSSDEDYVEAGRSRYGRKFRVDGDQTQVFSDSDGTRVP